MKAPVRGSAPLWQQNAPLRQPILVLGCANPVVRPNSYLDDRQKKTADVLLEGIPENRKTRGLLWMTADVLAQLSGNTV